MSKKTWFYLKYRVGHTRKRPFVSYGIYSEHVNSPLLRVLQNLNKMMCTKSSSIIFGSKRSSRSRSSSFWLKFSRKAVSQLSQLSHSFHLDIKMKGGASNYMLSLVVENIT